LLAPWTGAHGGTPPFDQIKTAAFEPGLAKAMDLDRGELAKIADATEPATFANTILALEDSGRELGRAASVFGTFTATMNDKAMQAVETSTMPKLAAFGDEITQVRAPRCRARQAGEGAARRDQPAAGIAVHDIQPERARR